MFLNTSSSWSGRCMEHQLVCYETLHPHPNRPAPCTHRRVRTDVEHIANGDAFAREVNVNVATGQCCANRERERRRRQIIQRVRRRRWAQRRRSSVRQSNSAGVPRETIDVHVAVETHCCIVSRLMTRRCSRASHTPYALYNDEKRSPCFLQFPANAAAEPPVNIFRSAMGSRLVAVTSSNNNHWALRGTFTQFLVSVT